MIRLGEVILTSEADSLLYVDTDSVHMTRFGLVILFVGTTALVVYHMILFVERMCPSAVPIGLLPIGRLRDRTTPVFLL